MKKLISILFVLSTSICFSQKSQKISNFSSYDFRIDNIYTKGTGWTGSVIPSPITALEYGDYFILQNSASVYKFPFHSPSSSPYITYWRWIGLEPEPLTLHSSDAWDLGEAADQVFDYISFCEVVGSTPVYCDNIGEYSFWVEELNGILIDPINGDWVVVYYIDINPNDSNEIAYYITFFDN